MSHILCHIAGPSGSGKTTILKKIALLFPSVVTKDLDEFDEQSEKVLGLDSARKEDWTDEDLKKNADLRQKMLDDFLLSNAGRKIVLAGFHTEDAHVLRIPTEERLMLDTSAEASALRAYARNQNEKPEHRRLPEDIPQDIENARKEIRSLLSGGYASMSEEAILELIAKLDASSRIL